MAREIIPILVLLEECPNGARRRYAVEPFERVLLHDGAVGSYHREHRFACTVRRWAEEGRTHCPGSEGPRNDLRLLRYGNDVAVGQSADINPANDGIGRAF